MSNKFPRQIHLETIHIDVHGLGVNAEMSTISLATRVGPVLFSFIVLGFIIVFFCDEILIVSVWGYLALSYEKLLFVSRHVLCTEIVVLVLHFWSTTAEIDVPAHITLSRS